MTEDPWNVVGKLGAFVIALIIAMGVTGNLLVLIVVIRSPRLRRSYNVFIASLSVSDLLFNVSIMPFYADSFLRRAWIYSQDLCLFVTFFGTISIMSSSLHIALIALNRYFLIVRPSFYPLVSSPQVLALQVALVWATSLSIVLPGVFGWNAVVGYTDQIGRCTYVRLESRVSLSLVFCVGFICPCLVMGFCYLMIWHRTKQSSKRIMNHYGHEDHQGRGASFDCVQSVSGVELTHKQRPSVALINIDAGCAAGLLNTETMNGAKVNVLPLQMISDRPRSSRTDASRSSDDEMALETKSRRTEEFLKQCETEEKRPLISVRDDSCLLSSNQNEKSLVRTDSKSIPDDTGEEEKKACLNVKVSLDKDTGILKAASVAASNKVERDLDRSDSSEFGNTERRSSSHSSSQTVLVHERNRTRSEPTRFGGVYKQTLRTIWKATNNAPPAIITVTEPTAAEPEPSDESPPRCTSSDATSGNRATGSTRGSISGCLTVDSSGLARRPSINEEHREDPESRRCQSQPPPPPTPCVHGSKPRMHSMRMILAIFFAFVFTYLPFTITNLVDQTSSLHRSWYMITSLGFWAGSCVNPVIYGIMNKQFRTGYTDVLCGRC